MKENGFAENKIQEMSRPRKINWKKISMVCVWNDDFHIDFFFLSDPTFFIYIFLNEG